MDLVRIENIRVIVIDDNQIQYNHLMDIFHAQGQSVTAVLLDDLLTLQKHIKKTWDIVFYSKAYDFDQDKLFELIKHSKQAYLPCLHLDHQENTKNRYALNSYFFDQVNLNHPKHLLFTFNKALQFSYLWQEKQRLDKDLENIQQQVKTTSEHMQDASMVVQEGIIMETNQYFKDMFQIDDAFGLPLLDVLQPKNSEQFKQQLKLINVNSAQTYHLEIESINTVLKNKNLSLKIFSNQEEESLHISIGQHQVTEFTKNKAPKYFEQVNQIISKHSGTTSENILISLSVNLNIDASELTQEEYIGQYISDTTTQIKTFFSDGFITVSPFQWIGVAQIKAPLTFGEIQTQLNHLVKSSTLPLQLGYCIFNDTLKSEDQFYALYAKSQTKTTAHIAESTHGKIEQETMPVLEAPSLSLVENEDKPTIQTIDTPIPQPAEQIPQPEMFSPPAPQSTSIPVPENDTFATHSNYQTGVKYQQVYDKYDTNQHMFEASTTYVDANGISYNLNYADEPPLINSASLIQIDQNTIKTACQNLYHFCQTTPDANIIINLHHSSLESPLASYLTSVLQQTPGLNANKIILQFNALDIINLNLQIHPTWAMLKQMNVGIGLRHFNFNNRKITLLGQIQPKICFMALNLEQILSNVTQHQYIQDQFSHFKNTDFVIPNLNDMNEFANAWNVDCRYLQGQYFQDKLDQMTNI